MYKSKQKFQKWIVEYIFKILRQNGNVPKSKASLEQAMIDDYSQIGKEFIDKFKVINIAKRDEIKKS